MSRLARWLRLMGADVICDPNLNGAQLLRLARAQNRVMLTRDKRLRTAFDVLFLESDNFRDQLRQVMARFPFDPALRSFTRCLRCNQPLVAVSREIVQRRVPPFVYASTDRFAECGGCGRIYWPATHTERARRALEALGIISPS